MKIFLECPNCKNIYKKTLEGKLTSNNLKSIVSTMSYCPQCLKNNLGKILLKVKKFDWEKETETTNSSTVPIKLDPNKISDERLSQIIQREKDLISHNE